jgi:hypothetical protein
MKTETVLILVGVAGVAYLIYRQQQAQAATRISTPQQNPNQVNGNVQPANRPIDYIHAGVDALDKISDHFGGF